jgi:hypothetical protein
MAKLTIEIDTASSDSESKSLVVSEGKSLLTANKIGLLSTIPLSSSGSSLPIADAFWSAVGQTKEEKDNLGYIAKGLLDGKTYLKDTKNCKAIATAGGLSAFTAINGANDIPFVSLVGWVPTSVNNQCRGGVSLESYRSSLRRQYLIDHFPGVQLAANIYLLTNNNSPYFHQAESTDWGNPGTLIESYVGDGSGNNDASKFSWDWSSVGGNPAKIPDTATAVVISDDPFFQANQQTLVSLANTWLTTNATRRVVFPSTNYSTTGQSHANQMIVMASDLVAAYRLLGALAASVSLNPNVNFGFIKLGLPVPA